VELGQFGSGNQELEFLVGSQENESKKKGKEKKNGTMKGSIPRSEFEAKMEKGSEEVNPKIFAPRADLGGREVVGRDNELMGSAGGGLFGLSPNF
jgi:hypothetical protein